MASGFLQSEPKHEEDNTNKDNEERAAVFQYLLECWYSAQLN